MKLTKNQIKALKIKRGERNLTINHLSNEIGLSRFTVSRILHNGENEEITPTTSRKVNDWLIKEFNQDILEELK